MRSRDRSASLGAYWREVRGKAFGKPRSVLDWAEYVIVGGLTLGFLFMAVGREKAMEEVVKTTVYLLAVVLSSVVFGAIRVWQASWAIHREDLALVASIERRRDELESTLGGEREAHSKALAAIEQASHADSQRHGVADALTELHTEATHKLLNDAPPDINVAGAYDAWFAAEAEWTTRLLKAMQALGCTKQEIAFVRDIPFPGVTRTNRFRSMLNEGWTILDIRLERLGKVIDAYAPRPTFTL